MKKLISVSILAAALASTVAFALPGPGGNNAPAAPAKAQLIQSQSQAPNLAVFTRIAQTAIDSSTGGNTLVKANFVFGDNNQLSNGTVVFAKVIQSNDNEAMQAAFVSAVREAVGSNGAGWKFAKFVASNNAANGNIGTLYIVNAKQDDNHVQAIAISVQGKTISLAQAAPSKAIASELLGAKSGPSMKAVVVAG